jgi:hypothetical protein
VRYPVQVNQDNDSAQGGRDDRHPRSRREDLHERCDCTRADHEQAENLRALLVGRGTLAVPAPLPFEVLLEILFGTSLTGFRSWVAFSGLIRLAVLAHRSWPVLLRYRT